MKLHATPSHPDYHPAAQHASIYLDDVRQHFAVHADDEAGTVERFVESPFGPTETVHGKVRIELDEQGLALLKAFPR